MLFMLARVRTPSSLVREREREIKRERDKEREREKEIKREREGNVDMVTEFNSLLLTVAALQIKYSAMSLLDFQSTQNSNGC